MNPIFKCDTYTNYGRLKTNPYLCNRIRTKEDAGDDKHLREY